MITFKTRNFQVTISGDDEYCIYVEEGIHPIGYECEVLVIQTPRKKYRIIGIDTGKLDGYEIVEYVLNYIKINNIEPNIYIDLDEIYEAELACETIAAVLEVAE